MHGMTTSGETLGAELPSLPEHERRVLGGALISDEARTLLFNSAAPDDFYSMTNRTVFEALKEAPVTDNGEIDAPLLAHQLEVKGLIPEVGDRLMYLMGLYEAAASTALYESYLSDLRGCRNARALHALAGSLATTALESRGDSQRVSSALTDAEEKLTELSSEVAPPQYMSIREVLESDFIEQPITAQSGFYELDNILSGGFREQQVVVTAGRPAMGKSAIALDFLRNASIRQGIPSLLVSLEMSFSEVTRRAQAAEAQVPLGDIIKDTLDPYDMRLVKEATERLLEPAPLYIVTPPSSVSAVVTVIREVVSKHGVKIVCIDYLQMLATEGDSKDGRQNFVASVSRMIKSIARELHITIILVAQLNRGPETRGGDHRPMLSDLRESGQIEQDADVILFLNRPEYYDPGERQGEADLIVAKQRNGGTGVVPLAFLGHYTKFANMAAVQPPDMD